MPLTYSQIKDKIRLFAIRKFDEDKLGDLDDTEMLNIFNQVADDFNIEGAIRRERYYNKTTAGETNYEMQGVIRRVYLFKYEDTAFETQYWTFVNDTIVFKNSPGGQVQLDIHYLRAVEAISSPTDEVDLPETVLLDYLDLIKKRLEVEYGDAEEAVYTAYLKQKGRQARRGRHIQPISPGVMRVWGTYDSDDTIYDITDNWVSQDSVTADVAGYYYFIS